MSIQTAFRQTFEPFLAEYGFTYWKKGFYKYDRDGQLVFGIQMMIDRGKRELITYVEIGSFVDCLTKSREEPGLDGMSFWKTTEHPLYAQKTDNSYKRMTWRKVGDLSVCDDLGPYNDELALEQFEKQKNFMAEYLLPDYLKIHDTQGLFELNW